MLNESDVMTDGPGNSKLRPKSTSTIDGSRSPILTIDGPAASGKSSVSRELARRLGWQWVSTGTFYRGIAWAANEIGLNLEDEGALVQFIGSGRWKVELTAPTTCFLLDGFDRTDEITKEAVGSLASKISSYPRVRVALLDAQRKCASADQGLIAEGRDCGTVVFPTAEVKVFLTARAEDRAQRRANEEGRSLEEMISDQEQRDRQDANRKTAPMVVPDGALKIDTSQFSFIEVVEKIEQLVRATIAIGKEI